MAATESYTNIYSKTGTFIDVILDYDYVVGDRPTIGDLLNTSVCIGNGVTELSATQGGAALDHSLDANESAVDTYGENIIFYDATPDVPDIALRIHNSRIRR